jgi:anti-sigma factor RsiW
VPPTARGTGALAFAAKHNRPPPSEQDLQDYVDGRLDAGQEAEIATYLAQHPEAAARIERYRAHIAGMHALYDAVLTEPIPSGMQGLLQRAAARHRRPRLALALALAAAALVGASIVGIAVLRGGGGVRPKGEVAAAQEAYLRFATAPAWESDVTELRDDSLERLLSERFGAAVTLPDAARTGFTLKAVRLLPAQHPAALLLYRDRANHPALLYVAADAGSDERGDSAAAGVRTFFHSAHGIFYALTVSAGEPDEMARRVSTMAP